MRADLSVMNTVFSILEESARRFPDLPALVDERGRMTFAELHAEAIAVRDAASANGVLAGHAAGLRAGNGRAFIAGLFGLSGAGAVVVPIDPKLSANETSEFVRMLPLSSIFSEPSLQTLSRDCAEISVCGERFRLEHSGAAALGPFAPHVPGAAFVRPTSGTTGKSKGVILSHRAVFERLEAAQRALELAPGDKVAWVLPMAYHFVVSILLYAKAGACAVVCKDHLASSIIKSANSEGCSIIYASPYHYALLSSDESGLPLATVRKAICTSGLASSQILQRFKLRFGIPLRQVYGLIEVGLPLGNFSDPECDPETIGRPLPGFEAKLIGAIEGDVGELIVRGPGMFDGYLTPAALSGELPGDGWFHTGDLALALPDGSFKIVGRKKSVIITAGNKVFPEEVEHVLTEHPAVRNARVFGRKHPLIGELVAAEVTLREPAQVREEDLRSFCRERLGSFKTPQELSFVDSIAMTGSGKIVRY